MSAAPDRGLDDVPPHVVNWATLPPHQAAEEWMLLDQWVYWLRDTFGLTPQELPPLWHRHSELVWELSALHTAFQAAHAPKANPGASLVWMRDFAATRTRLKRWVQDCGTELTQDRETRLTTWPGEPPAPSPAVVPVTDRAADFHAHVAHDVAARRAAQDSESNGSST
ncbi:hypothetical protein GCM10028784_30310 [Myceligenerans cantabricum]